MTLTNMPILSVVVALLASAASPPVVAQEPPSFRRFGFEPEPGARISVAVPDALTTVDVEYWIAVLELEPEAAATLRAAVDEFYDSRTPEIVKVIEPVDRAATELARRGGFQIMQLPDAPEAYRELVRLRDRAVNRFNAIEEELFDRGALNRSTPYERLSRPKGPRGVSDEAFEQEASPSRGGGRQAQAG